MSAGPSRPIDSPASDLPFNTRLIKSGTEIHRIHNEKWQPDAFNPGASIDSAAGNVGSRFAPIRSRGRFVPTMYGANSLGCAAFETIFHDIDPAARFKTVSMSALSSLRYSVLTLNEELQLTPLFTPDLKKLSLERRDLIDCPALHYSITRPWAAAIHDSPRSPAGLIWASRQFDEDKAYMLFGTRIDHSYLTVARSVSIVGHAETLEQLRQFGERAGITIIHS